jgi:hypothetical protein
VQNHQKPKRLGVYARRVPTPALSIEQSSSLRKIDEDSSVIYLGAKYPESASLNELSESSLNELKLTASEKAVLRIGFETTDVTSVTNSEVNTMNSSKFIKRINNNQLIVPSPRFANKVNSIRYNERYNLRRIERKDYNEANNWKKFNKYLEKLD